MKKPDAVVLVAEPKKGKKLTLPIPEGLDLEDKEDGETLEVVAEFKLEDGKLCLKAINGIEVADYPNDEEKPPGPRNFAEAVTGQTEDEY